MKQWGIKTFFLSFKAFNLFLRSKIQTKIQEYIHGSVLSMYDTKTRFYLIFEIGLSQVYSKFILINEMIIKDLKTWEGLHCLIRLN